jgi:hypothetical protein
VGDAPIRSVTATVAPTPEPDDALIVQEWSPELNPVGTAETEVLNGVVPDVALNRSHSQAPRESDTGTPEAGLVVLNVSV